MHLVYGQPCEGEPTLDAARPGRFAPEQLALAFDAPAVARQTAIAAHDPMTRNDDGQRIGATGLRHGAHRACATNALRDVGVRRGAPGGDLAQGLPHLLLKRGAARIDAQCEALPGRLDQAHDIRQHALA